MESKAKLFGHAIHPILIVYPLGLLSTAVVFDIIYLVTANPTWATVSFWMIAAGVVGGLMAAAFGLVDYINIPNGTRAKPPTLAFVLSFVGVGAALLGGWLGGELVERLGVGVAENANLNAPNSLTQSDRNEVRISDKHHPRHA